MRPALTCGWIRILWNSSTDSGPGFEQDVVGDGELADVEQQRRRTQCVDVGGGKPDRLAQGRGPGAAPLQALARRVVLGVDRAGQRFDERRVHVVGRRVPADARLRPIAQGEHRPAAAPRPTPIISAPVSALPPSQQKCAGNGASRRQGQQPDGEENEATNVSVSLVRDRSATLVPPSPPASARQALTLAGVEWHCDGMAVTLATRLRALWLVWLLVLAPAGPAACCSPATSPAESEHVVTSAVHDATNHGISCRAAGPVAPATVTARTARPPPRSDSAGSNRRGYLRAPDSASIDWIELQGGAPAFGFPRRAPRPRASDAAPDRPTGRPVSLTRYEHS